MCSRRPPFVLARSAALRALGQRVEPRIPVSAAEAAVRPGDLPAAPVGFGVVDGEQPVPRRRGMAASQLSSTWPTMSQDGAEAGAGGAGAGGSGGGHPPMGLGAGGRTAVAGSASSHGGLFSLVMLLMLITSLALLARSRAWVVFRWVGVAAPAQRCVRGMAQRMAARFPDRCGCCRGCRATARTLRHNGSGCGLCGLTEMAVPPLTRGQVPRRATPVARCGPSMARGLLPVTPGSPLDPVVGGSL